MFSRPGKYQNNQDLTQVVLHPVAANYSEAPILLDISLIPNSVASVIVQSPEIGRSFKINLKADDRFIILLDGDKPLTYKEAYTRLGLTSISMLRLSPSK